MTSNLEDYDFIELRVYDLHGYAKAFCFSGVKGQSNQYVYKWKGTGFGNYRIVPIESTLKPCQEAVSEHRKVASVLCELRYPDGTLETSMPRETTLALLQLLKEELGLTIRSTFEMEFGIRHADVGKQFVHESNLANLVATQSSGGVLLDLLESMQAIGIKTDTLMSECGPGQFEVTCDVTEGVELNTSYCNGFHYNFSLWDSKGQNVFANRDNPKEMSNFGRHWLAGLVKHCPALIAFCSPTINCYRRIGAHCTAKFVNWSQENRTTSFRVKIEAGGNVYIENRLPSSACHPHLILASTLAAGMDGVRRKLDLPEPRDESTRLPTTLEDALNALEMDTILKTILGEKLVKMHIYVKRKFEIDEFKVAGELSDNDRLVKEKKYYYHPN